MAYNFVLNSKNLVPNIQAQNVFQYNFPQGSLTIPEGSTMTINQLTIPYSWRNITSALGNNTIAYTMPTATITYTSTSTITTAGVFNDTNGRIGAILLIPNATSSGTIPSFIYITGGVSGAWTTNIKPSATITIGASATTANSYYPITLSDGFYTTADIQSAIQATMKTNGHYWYDTQATYSQQFQFTGTISGGNLLTIDAGFKQVQLQVGYVLSYVGAGGTSYVTTSITSISSSANGVYGITASSVNCPTGTGITAQLVSELSPTIIYPLSIATNASLYTNTITSLTIPVLANIASRFGSGWSQSNGLNGQNNWANYPTTGNQYATLSFPTTTSTTQTIANILGFTSSGLGVSYYPALSTTTAVSVTSNGNSLSAQPPFAPKGSPVNGIVVRCNLVSNPVSQYNDVLDTAPITSTYGSNINYLPISNNEIKLMAGKYSSLQITFNDDNFNALYLIDPTILLSIIILFP
jgi:hypothetical protein